MVSFCCFFLSSSYANNVELPPVSIETKPPSSLISPLSHIAQMRTNKTPGGINFLDHTSFQRYRVSHLEDLFQSVPGVYAKSRFGSEDVRLSIRGSSIQQNFQTRGVELVQDGVPIALTEGFGDTNAIDPLAIKYVEVYRGANALALGSTVLGGAIHFVSPTGYDVPLSQARFEVGSFKTLQSQVSTGQVINNFDYYLSLSQIEQEGYRNHSDQDTKRIFFNGGWRKGDVFEKRVYLKLVKSKSKLPGTLTSLQLLQNPKQAQQSRITRNEKRNFDLISLSSRMKWKKGGQAVESTVYWNRKDLDNPVFRVNDQVSHDIGLHLHYDVKSHLWDKQNHFQLGVFPRWGIKKDARYFNVGGDHGNKFKESDKIATQWDMYFENRYEVMPSTELSLGLQWSVSRRAQKDDFLGDGDHSGHLIYRAWNPKVGLLYQINPDVQVYTNFSRSFEPPSFVDLTDDPGQGLTLLEPQRAWTLEVGSRGQSKRFSWDIAYYYSWVEDELLSLTDETGFSLGTVNAASTRHQGIEFGGKVLLKKNIFASEPSEDIFFLQGTYHWNRFRFQNHPVFSSNQLPAIPEHSFFLKLGYEHSSGLFMGMHAEGVMTSYPVDMANSLKVDPYVIMGVALGYRKSRGISLFTQVNNLADKSYVNTVNAIADAQGRDLAVLFPGVGREWIGGIEWKWG